MASKFMRRRTWWVKFHHPVTGVRIRESLETHDPARAELLRQRVEFEVALRDPRFSAADIPPRLRRTIDSWNHESPGSPEAVAKNGTSLPIMAAPPAAPNRITTRVAVDEALRGYFAFIRTDNAARHVENKLSMLRRFLGGQHAEQFVTSDDPVTRERRLKKAHEPFFTGTFLDEITPPLLQEFFTQLDVSTKTKRHYREFFHHFFEYCVDFGLHRPENFHCPNPVAALPTYLDRNRRIVFLDEAQVEEELRLLEPHPAIRIAVAIMIYAGLRRAEVVWLTREAISPDLSFLSVVNRIDHETDIESSLKTGERAVTILPPLKSLLEEYLADLRGRWVVPSSKGRRRNGDAFGKRLRAINDKAGQKWTCLHYRHTYATQRAAKGWPLFRIAKELGNSVAVVEEYYAAYVRPEGSASAPQ